MRYPVNNWALWYNAQPFGVRTSYGWHEGDDINLRTGGDSDLGQPLLAIADGTVTSVHLHSGTPTFGKHIHIRHDGRWGTVWNHYAHCDSIGVKVGDVVSEGQQVATLGKSGTIWAHLHWAIKLQPTGIDGIARTLDDLKKWTSPIKFVEKYMEEEMDDELLQYLGVNNNDEAKARLKEHLGEWEGKCDWGNASGSRGGYLGAERRKNASLEEQVNSLIQQLDDCEEQNGSQPPEVPAGWTENGLSITTVEGNRKTTINYKKD